MANYRINYNKKVGTNLFTKISLASWRRARPRYPGRSNRLSGVIPHKYNGSGHHPRLFIFVQLIQIARYQKVTHNNNGSLTHKKTTTLHKHKRQVS